jgi:hypothetical protein
MLLACAAIDGIGSIGMLLAVVASVAFIAIAGMVKERPRPKPPTQRAGLPPFPLAALPPLAPENGRDPIGTASMRSS